jgi:O-antigen/teichoic acid export membrane protein
VVAKARGIGPADFQPTGSAKTIVVVSEDQEQVNLPLLRTDAQGRRCFNDEAKSAVPATQSAIPSLRHNFAWTFVGSGLYAGCQWGMLSTLAKLGSASIVGEFTLGLAVAAPVFMFTNLQLRAVQATDVRKEHRFAHYFTLRLLATLFGLAAVACILPFIRATPAVRLVVFLVAVSKSIECMSDATAGLLQREEQLRKVAISMMIRGICSVMVFAILFAYFHSAALSVLAMSGVWFAVLMLYDLPNAKAVIDPGDGLFGFDMRQLRKVAMLGLPLGWVATLISLNTNMPRYFLQHYLGFADQGIYASLAYLVVAINLVVTALSVSVTTRLAHMFAHGERRRFFRMLLKLSMLGVLVVAVGVPFSLLVGRPLLTVLYRPEYGEHVGLLAVLVAATGVSTIGSFLFCGMTAARAFRAQVPVYAAALAAGMVGAALLIPRWGLIGAGAAVLISAATIVVGGLMVMRVVLRLRAA